MRKTKTKLFALVTAVTVMFTGCMTEDATVKINSDGTATVSAVVDIDKAVFDSYMSGVGMDASSMSGEYQVVTKDGKEYYEATENKTTDVIGLGEVLKEAVSSDVYATMDTVYSEVTLAQSETVSMYKTMGIDTSAVKLNLSIEFPAAVTATTGTIDSTNPNKVSYVIDLSTSSMIVFATTNPTVTQDSVKATVAELNKVHKVTVKKLKADKVTGKKASVTLKIKKVKDATKYQVQWSKNKTFKKKTQKNITKTTYQIKNLKKKTNYFVRVRAVKKNYCGTLVYGNWTVKKVKTK